MIPTWTISNSAYAVNKVTTRAVRNTYRGSVSARSAKSTYVIGASNGAVNMTYTSRASAGASNTTGSSARAMNARARNSRRMLPAARMLFFLLAFVLLFSGFTFMRSFASSGQVPPAAAAESVFVVDSGDTLWSVATAVKQPSMDTRRAVHLLVKRNHLQNNTALIAGQTLIIPAQLNASE